MIGLVDIPSSLSIVHDVLLLLTAFIGLVSTYLIYKVNQVHKIVNSAADRQAAALEAARVEILELKEALREGER